MTNAWSVLCLLLLCCVALAAFSESSLPLSLDTAWRLESKGAWRARMDHRALLAMAHPWQPSNKGDFSLAWRTVKIPEDWKEPIALSVYCSDDYQALPAYAGADWLTAEGFINHRYKQVLVDTNVVWNQDVADPSLQGTPPALRIPLNVHPGQEFRLSLLVYDAEASPVVLSHDFYHSAKDEKKRAEDPDASKFMTHVYWGDIVLVQGDYQLPPGRRPIEEKVQAVHATRWPLPPFGDGWDKPSVTLEISAPAGLPKQGFPLQMGLPFPAGKVKNGTAWSLIKDGKPIPAQQTVLGQWPDDSLRWALLDYPVLPGTATLELGFSITPPPMENLLQAEEKDGIYRINAQPLYFELGNDALLEKLRLDGPILVHAIKMMLSTQGKDFPAEVKSVHTTTAGAFRRTFAVEGRFFLPEEPHAGSFTLYVSAYAGMPFVKLWLRMFNDTKADLPIAGLPLTLELPIPCARFRMPCGDAPDGFTLKQTSENKRTLNGESVDPKAPCFVQWDDGVVVVRQFRELFPKSVHAQDTHITLDLAAGGDTPVTLTPGEALSHELWIALGEIDPAQFAATVQQPPILQNADYFCATGVLGHARKHMEIDKINNKQTELYKNKSWGDLGQHYGLRTFPDAPYMTGLPAWCNNYYERMLGAWSEWFMSGDREWFDRAQDLCRHIMDTAIIHSEVPGQDWLGAMHGPGKNHVGGPWAPTMRVAGLELFQKLTGEPEAREAFLGVADFCVRKSYATGSPSVRDHAGPFDAVCTAYWETNEPAFLDDGSARIVSALKVMDRRRGAWSEEHGSRVYRGNVPWMIAQLARPLYWWYAMTGDTEAAQALAGLAESVVCENTDWDTPGLVSGYSHNPHYAMTANYDPMILPMIFAAYELTEDPYFLDAAKAQWERWKASDAFDSVFNTYWNTPWMMWYLHKHQIK